MGLFVWWCLLACLRLMLTLLPQSGYIHPDEFFQSVEIAAGDLLEVESLRTWEFNSSFPIRSIVPVYLVSGPAMVILRTLRSAGFPNIVSSYTVLVMPRLVMLFLSFLIDLCVFRIIEFLGGNGKAGAVLVASSYVTIVYYTRTFSNSFEGVLFAVLLLETLTVEKSSRPSTVQSKTREKDSHLRSRHDSVLVRSSAIRIALVIVLGLFNRPTFAAFAAVPYVYWVFKGNTTNRSLYADRVLWKVLGSSTSAVFFAAFLVTCDSVYFGHLSPCPGEIISTLQDAGFCDFLLKNLTVTPLNFLLYNTQFNNLASHGVHPAYLHVVINVQILFCILGIFAAKDLIRLAIFVLRNGMSSVDSVRSVLLLSYVVPLLLLSVFPHQEPRFLIPLLCPLAVVCSADVFGSKSRKYVTDLWVIFNIFGLVFFGFMHQGGVIRAISRLSDDAIAATHHQTTDVVFWRTYMPPRHLFLSPKHRVLAEPRYQVHDLAGASKERLFEFLSSFKNSSSKGSRLLLLSPGSLQHEVHCFHDSFDIQVIDRFWPHFSGEDFPTADLIQCREEVQSKCILNVDCKSQCLLERIYNAFSLHLYRVRRKARD